MGRREFAPVGQAPLAEQVTTGVSRGFAREIGASENTIRAAVRGAGLKPLTLRAIERALAAAGLRAPQEQRAV